MPEGRQPRGGTSRARSGAVAESARLRECRGWKEQSHIQGQGQKPGGPHSRGAAAKRSYPTPEVRGGSREELPHVQGVVAAQAQEGLEELFHVQGQEGRW